MFNIKLLKYTLMFTIFSLGLYYVINQPMIENFESNTSVRCPNLLIQRGTKFFLKNTNLADVPGVNPIEFNNLDEYVEFTKWQRSQSIRCPILFVQEVYDAQGERVYNLKPDPQNPHTGLSDFTIDTKLLDAGRDDPPFNKNSYPGYDEQSQYIGLKTPLDNMFNVNTRNINYDHNQNSHQDTALYYNDDTSNSSSVTAMNNAKERNEIFN